MRGRRIAAKTGLLLVLGVPPGLALAQPAADRAPLELVAHAPARSQLPPVSLAPTGLWPADERAAVLLAHARRRLSDARFDEALALTEEARALLAPYGRKQRALRHKASLEVTAATAYVALERRREALACFERALRVEPDLELDSARTSPKVLRVFREARSAQ